MELQPSSLMTVICSYYCMYATCKPGYLALLYSSLFYQCNDKTVVTKVLPCIYGVSTSAATKSESKHGYQSQQSTLYLTTQTALEV